MYKVRPNDPYGYVPTMSQINAIEKNAGTVISTFSGVGGSSLGYKMAGFNVLAAIEFLDYQAKTYRANHPDTRVYEADIRKLNPLIILKQLGLEKGELDILDGSPPCSDFSTSGRRDKGWKKVKSYGNRKQRVDDLFFEYTRFLRSIQPKVFIAENVSGLVKGRAKGYFLKIFKSLEDCGYTVRAKLLNAKYYGVPQARERVIFMGVRKDLQLEPVYPKGYTTIIPLGIAFKEIENTPRQLAEADISDQVIYKRTIKLNPGKKDHERFNLYKMHPHKESKTLVQTAGILGAASIVHWDNRKFTVPEVKAISSMPKDFNLLGEYRHQVEACGRAVPPLMMYEIAKTIRDEIFSNIKRSSDV